MWQNLHFPLLFLLSLDRLIIEEYGGKPMSEDSGVSPNCPATIPGFHQNLPLQFRGFTKLSYCSASVRYLHLGKIHLYLHFCSTSYPSVCGTYWIKNVLQNRLFFMAHSFGAATDLSWRVAAEQLERDGSCDHLTRVDPPHSFVLEAALDKGAQALRRSWYESDTWNF